MAEVNGPYTWIDLMKYRTAKPFRPFFLQMRSGERVEVLGSLWFGGASDRLAVYDPRKGLRHYRRNDVVGVTSMSGDEVLERLHLLRKPRRSA